MRQAAKLRPGPHGGPYVRGEVAKFLGELSTMVRRLGLPRGVEARARSICLDAAAMRFCRVVPRSVLGAAALYIACREFKTPVTLREIAGAYQCDPRDVGRCYDTMLERMHISRPNLNGKTFVRHLRLGQPLSEETYASSEEMIRRSTAAGLGGRNPMTLAAAALYLASCNSGERVTQAEVAEAAGVGEESVRECCKALRGASAPPAGLGS